MFNCQHDYYLIFGIWMWICCAFGIWVWVLDSAPPLKGYSQKWKYENLCNAYMGATKTKSIKGHAILACLWLTKKTIITTKLTYRVSVFFPHWQYLVRFIYLLCRLVLRFAVVAGNSIHSSFFLFFFYVYVFPSFSFFFPFLMLAFQFRWKVLLLFFYFRIRYRYIFVASYSMIEQSSVCRFKRGAANVKKVSYVFAMTM